MISLVRLRDALADRYAIQEELGAGGMATVYLAEDLKHDRKVAVKVLRPELAAVLGAERFVAEIKTTASLQHPHILPLFDSGEADSFLYYVMPYIDGETLRDKLNRETQLSVDGAVQITTDVADALDYAHRHGVIHRDIKPENILLHDGRPMVADFGIALAVSAAAGGRMTETGMSLGTPHYMSPEQATAEKDLTHRSDIYSLGAVLYEMLTGNPPHLGSSAQQIIMRIVTDEARPVTEVRKSVPPNVAAALARSLEKIAADRFEEARGFAAALQDPNYAPPVVGTRIPSRVPNRPSPLTVGLVMGVVVLAMTALWGWMRPESPARVVKFAVQTRGGYAVPFGQPNIALSPDGSTLVFADDGRLSLHRMDEFETVPISGTEGAISVFFSPDGQSIGFNQDGALRRVSLAGGPPVDIVRDVGVVMGASWGDDGSIAFAPVLGSAGIFRVSAAGGVPERVTTPVDSLGETGHRWPQVLPGSNELLYTANGPSSGWDDARLVVHEFATGKRTFVMEQATGGAYVHTGHLLYAQPTGALVAVPFDVRRPAVPGTPVGMLPLVQLSAVSGGASYAVSANGVLAFVEDSIWAAQSLRMMRRSGDPVGTVGPSLYGDFTALSPAGTQVALTIRSARNDDIYVIDVTTGDVARISTDIAEDETPIWSPDGTRLAYTAPVSPRTSQRMYVQSADAGASANVVYVGPNHFHLASWSPDGAWLAFYEFHPDRAEDVWALNVESGELVAIDTTAAAALDGVFSPDGRWVAYDRANESGRYDIWVVSFPDPSIGRRQVTTAGGVTPRWTKNGTEIVFFQGGTIYAVPVATGETFRVRGAAEPLFAVPDMSMNDTSADYDVSSDGDTFIILTDDPEATPQEIRVILNFADELRARMEGST